MHMKLTHTICLNIHTHVQLSSSVCMQMDPLRAPSIDAWHRMRFGIKSEALLSRERKEGRG
jgi:hypothetical protein